jgi:hypothetical protein
MSAYWPVAANYLIYATLSLVYPMPVRLAAHEDNPAGGFEMIK